MEDIEGQLLPFLSHVIQFQDGIAYELLKPITNFKSCHDGTPAEARVLFTCRQVNGSGRDEPPTAAESKEEVFIMKVKVQIVSPSSTTPDVGPSDTTAHELKALEKFREAKTPFAPHLVAFKRDVQLENGQLPGGYMTYTVMTMLPGKTLLALGYWNLDAEKREEISRSFSIALRAIYGIGVETVDRGLRNVLWESEGKRCAIIDFELWNECQGIVMDEKRELQRWGLQRQPTPKNHWEAWSMHMR